MMVVAGTGHSTAQDSRNGKPKNGFAPHAGNPQRQLWPYQREMLTKLQQALPAGPIMATLATGGGKTAVAACLAAGYRRVLFVAPSRSVVDQAPREFRKWGVLAANASDGKWDSVSTSNAKVVVASYRLAGNRLQRRSHLTQFDLLIVDEAHHAADGRSMATRLVQDAQASGIHVLGMTATCWRLSRKEGFTRTWRQLLQFADWGTLQKTGYLADCQLHFLNLEKVIRGGKPGSHGEYTDANILDLNRRRPLFTRGAVDWWAAVARRSGQKRWLSTICYAVGQTHAVNVARCFREKGARVGLILSGKDHLKHTPRDIVTDTKTAIDRFQRGALDVLVNVQMVTEGFDAPSSGCVLVLRPTMSVALWLQICGRGSRLDRENGKTALLLLDATDNARRLRHPLHPRRWQLAPRGKEPKGRGGLQRKCQPQYQRSCGVLLAPATKVCPTCLQCQGESCLTCGRFTLWQRFAEAGSELCPACELGRKLRWQELWHKQAIGKWWHFWKELWVAPDYPERLPANALYAEIRKEEYLGTYQVRLKRKLGGGHSEPTNTPMAPTDRFEKARELAYDLYHKRKRQDGK